jgi:hypothetical protein
MSRVLSCVLLLSFLPPFAFAGNTKRPLLQTSNEINTYDPRLINPLMATSTMIAQMLPPTNSDGTLNQARQDTAVKSAVQSLVNNGLVPAPTSTIPLSDMQSFALSVAHSQNQYKDVQISTPLLLLIKNVVASDTTNGQVNWTNCTATTTCVQQDINDLISMAVSGGQITLATGVTLQQMQAFGYDLAKIVDTYNRSGY